MNNALHRRQKLKSHIPNVPREKFSLWPRIALGASANSAVPMNNAKSASLAGQRAVRALLAIRPTIAVANPILKIARGSDARSQNYSCFAGAPFMPEFFAARGAYALYGVLADHFDDAGHEVFRWHEMD
jgi:hypothetical protein